MTRLTPILTALIVAVLPALSSSDEVGCHPTYLEVSPDNLVVRFDPLWDVEFNGILIGCEADLARIDTSALAKVREALTALALEKHFNLYRQASEPDFRREVGRRLNEALDHDLISDIYFNEMALTEYRPVEPEGDPKEPPKASESPTDYYRRGGGSPTEEVPD